MMSSSGSGSSGSGLAGWPTGLPVPLLGRQHTLIPRDVATEMESRRRRKRRVYMDSIEVIEVQWNFTGDQFDTFKTFFEETLENGELPFEMVTYDPSEVYGQVQEVTRLLVFHQADYTLSESDNLVSVQAALEVWEEAVSLIADPHFPEEPLNVTWPDGEEEDSCRDTIQLSWAWREGDVIEASNTDATSDSNWYSYLTPSPTAAEVEAGEITIALNNDFDFDDGNQFLLFYQLSIGSLPSPPAPGTDPTNGVVGVAGSTDLQIKAYHWETGQEVVGVSESLTPFKATYWAKLRAAIDDYDGSDVKARVIKDYIAAIAGKTRWFRIRNGNVVRTVAVRARASKISAPWISVSGGPYEQHEFFYKLEASPLIKSDEDQSPFYAPLSWLENPTFNPLEVYVEPRKRLEYYSSINAKYSSVDGYPVWAGDGAFSPKADNWDGVPTVVTAVTPDSGAKIRWTINRSDPIEDMAWPPRITDGVANNARVYYGEFGGVIKGRCFQGTCKSPMSTVIIDKRHRLIEYGGFVGLAGFTFGSCDLWASGNSCIIRYGSVKNYDDDRDAKLCAALTPGTSGNSYDTFLNRWIIWKKWKQEYNTGKHTLWLAKFLAESFNCQAVKLRYEPQLYEYVLAGLDPDGPGVQEADIELKVKEPGDAGHAAGDNGSLSEHISLVSDFMLGGVPGCLGMEQVDQLNLRYFDVRISVYNDADLEPPAPSHPDYDPNTLDIPEPPAVDDGGYELWDEYFDSSDASQLTMDGGQLWSEDSDEYYWVVYSYTPDTGEELWEGYGGEDREIPDSVDVLTEDPDPEVFDKGEGWENVWVFYRYDYGGKEDWEDANIEDGEALYQALNGGTEWALDEDFPLQTPWRVYGYFEGGEELWADYDDGTMIPEPFAALKLDSISGGEAPATRGGKNFEVLNEDVENPNTSQALVKTATGKFDFAYELRGAFITPTPYNGGFRRSNSDMAFLYESNWTVRYWMYSSNVDIHPVIESRDGTTNGWRLETVSGVAKLRVVVGANDAVIESDTYTLNQWVRVVIKFVRGEGIYLQIDNNAIKFASHPNYINPPTVLDPFIHVKTPSIQAVPAGIDNFAIWDVALTAAQLLKDWDGGNGRQETSFDGGTGWLVNDPWKVINYYDESISIYEPFIYWRLLIGSNNNENTVGVLEFELWEDESGGSIATGGTPSASGNDAGLTPAEAFDGSLASGDGWGYTNNKVWPQWLQYQFPSAQEVVKYAVACYPTATSTNARSANNWQLQGSNDGSEWVTVDFQEDQTGWSFGQMRYFER